MIHEIHIDVSRYYNLIKNSNSSLQYLARSIVWMELLKLLELVMSVDVESSFQTLTIRTKTNIF